MTGNPGRPFPIGPSAFNASLRTVRIGLPASERIVMCGNKISEMPSKVKIIPKEKLMKTHTGTLMARRKQLLQCEESFTLSDRFGYENEPDPRQTGYIEFTANMGSGLDQ